MGIPKRAAPRSSAETAARRRTRGYRRLLEPTCYMVPDEQTRVRHAILAGEVRDTGSWSGLIEAIGNEVKDGASVSNLRSLVSSD